MKFDFRAAALAAFALAAATAADATTYLGTRAIGAGSANLSITTDGTLGVVTASNILDWTIVLNGVSGSATLNGPLSGNNSTLYFTNSFGTTTPTALTATATDLSFDYANYPPGVNNSAEYLLFVRFFTSGYNYLCIQQNSCANFIGGNDSVRIQHNANFAESYSSAILTGVQVIASVPSGAVPEPASWALMIVGFGLAGSALRTRRRATTPA